MKSSTYFSCVSITAKTFGVLALWIIAALSAMPARSAPPPDVRLLVSGDTVRLGLLPNVIDLPDGIVMKGSIEPSFAALVLEDDAIYVWTGATQSVDALPELEEGGSLLAPSMIAFYSPSTGLLEWGLVQTTAAGVTQVERQTGGTDALETLLAERGSYAVLNPLILPPTQPVPEPAMLLLLGAGVISLGRHAKRRRSRSVSA